jgi:hypothetical protein
VTLCVTGTRSVLPCIPTQSVGTINKALWFADPAVNTSSVGVSKLTPTVIGDDPSHAAELPAQTLRDTSVLKATPPLPELDNALG